VIKEEKIDLAIANAENAAGGMGSTSRALENFFGRY
jgi:calcineurin-like phosphoesterase